MFYEKDNLKTQKLKTKIKPSLTKPILSDPDVLAYLETRHRKYVIFPIEKASNNFAFICKKFYISKTLSEVGDYRSIQSNFTISKAIFFKYDVVKKMKTLFKKSIVKMTGKDRSLPIMYWLSEFHKIPI